MIRSNMTRTRAVALAASLCLVVAACGDDDDTTDTTGAAEPGTTASDGADTTLGAVDTTAAATTPATTSATTPATTAATGSTAPGEDAVDLDTNGDGSVVIGVATPGPRDDGAYYQALVEGIEELSTDNGYEDPIIVDNIDPSVAENELRNLARQNVDMIAVGAGEIADPLAALAEEFPEIFWYCNCGSGVPPIDGVAQTRDDSSQISYSAGYATGLLLQDTDKTKAAFLGCCDLDFEKEAYLAYELGLKAVDPKFTMTYIPTGDFNDVAGATEAFNQAVEDGAGAVYPFLGGSHEAVVGLANDAGIITMSAGVSDVCENSDLDYQIAVQFDAGDYLDTIFTKIFAGELTEDDDLVFTVGEYDFVGAKFCDATPEQVAALDEVKAQIANGDFEEQFGEIKGQAYGGG
jgi:basic membrane protein A